MTPKKTASITLSELTTRYVAHLDTEGKSLGTRFSYESELRLAQRELGAEISIGALSRDAIETFNNCPRVTILKSGRPKSQLSIDKTRRVLRLALAWAARTGLIATSPAEPIERAPEKPKARTKKSDDAPAPDAKPTKRKRKQAIVLEVAQHEAERAADEAEAMIAATTNEPAA